MRKQTNNKIQTRFFQILFVFFCFMLIISCNSNTENKKQQSTKFDQYYIQGEKLYTQHCSNCHQKNGKGLGRVYPPLDSSDFMTNSFQEVICLIKKGKNGNIVVNGIHYNQAMPGINSLTDIEVAEISTYIYNTWTHERGIVDVKEVSTVLNKCQ